MQYFRYLVAAFCLAACAACSVNSVNSEIDETAQASVAAPAADESAADPEGQYVNKLVCKRILHTGTRTNATKTCATVAQWEELSREAQNATNEVSRQAGQMNKMKGN